MSPDNIDFSVRLKAWRKRADLKQPKAAAVLGIGRSYYSRLESGRRQPGRFLLEKFALIEHEPVSFVHEQLSERSDRIREEARENHGVRSQLYSEESRKLRVRRVPLIGWAQAGEAVDFDAVIDWDNFISHEIDDPKAIAIRIRGDSMAPRYQDGDIAVLASSDPARNEDLVVARLREEGVVFKKLQIVDAQRGLYRLISFNDKYAVMDRNKEEFVWIYPVDAVIQKTRRR